MPRGFLVICKGIYKRWCMKTTVGVYWLQIQYDKKPCCDLEWKLEPTKKEIVAELKALKLK